MSAHVDRPGAPSTAVVVTHYRSVEALRASLLSVRDHADLADTEVVVADSEVQPGTEALVAEILPQARFLGFADDVGYAVSVNAALDVTTAPYVLVLNADVRIERGTVEGLRAALDADEGVGLVAPLLSYDDGTPQTSGFRFYRPTTVLHRRTPTGDTRWGRGVSVMGSESASRSPLERGTAAGDSPVGGAEIAPADTRVGSGT